MSKEKYFWLSVPCCSHIEDIKIIPLNNESEKKDLQGHLWFGPFEEKEAIDFLKDVKSCLRELYWKKYNHQDRADWMTDEWINK